MCGTTMINPAASPTTGATGSQASAPCCPPPPWMPIALAENAKGVAEISGATENPDVVRYMGMNRYGHRRDDNTSWCGSFVAYVLDKAGKSISTVPERALTWGRPSSHPEGYWPGGISIGRPIYGAIAVKSRQGGGHVTFVMGQDKDESTILHCLGGNQRNKLQVSRYSRSVFSAYMVPEDYPHSCCTLPIYNGTSTAAGSEE
ncbi:TIGR02594 family protein [Litoreibacter halocynthiae]|uniref:TIGR02594 family protein n=1 Tax=Litoreibacter halocynthiae TaxID=1242689 RepID=UPI002491B6B9|nr:TIGR02594 family protein [Litoreibacter halocynthiae]